MMDNFGKRFFSAATFTCDKNGHVRWRHLHGYTHRVVQQRRITNDSEPLLDILYFEFCNGHLCYNFSDKGSSRTVFYPDMNVLTFMIVFPGENNNLVCCIAALEMRSRFFGGAFDEHFVNLAQISLVAHKRMSILFFNHLGEPTLFYFERNVIAELLFGQRSRS